MSFFISVAYTSLLVNLLYGGVKSARRNRKVPYAAVVFGHITVSCQHIVRLQDIDFRSFPESDIYPVVVVT